MNIRALCTLLRVVTFLSLYNEYGTLCTNVYTKSFLTLQKKKIEESELEILKKKENIYKLNNFFYNDSY